MAKLGGAALKLFQTILYAIEFCCAGIILGVYGYFLSVLSDRDRNIPQWERAVTGMSGAACLYTLFAVLLTCFLGGKTIFAFLAIILDILFCGAFVAMAVLTRSGAHSCSGNVNTPIGSGMSNSKQGFGDSNGRNDQYTYAVSLGTACRLNSAAFAVSIAGALLFLISALVQFCIGRNHKKEKRYGPSPANGYTRGSGKKWFGRKNKNTTTTHHHRDAEMAGAGATAAGAHHYRHSNDTAITGSTVAPAGAQYENVHKPLAPATSGYHTAPTGTYATQPTHTHTTTATNY